MRVILMAIGLPIGAGVGGLILVILGVVLWRRSRRWLAIPAVLGGIVSIAISFPIWQLFHYSPTSNQLNAWINDPASRPALITSVPTPCPDAPFLLPSKGFIGFFYADNTYPDSPFNPHWGIDLFGDGAANTVPVYAAYDGYLSREADWVSSVVIRIPKDPLDPSRQIWVYYTHMASQSGDVSYISRDFPRGISEKFIKQGTLLGYQGLYNGSETSFITMHVHMSLVLSDQHGGFDNDDVFSHTVDPSPYLGMNVNAQKNPTIPATCGK